MLYKFDQKNQIYKDSNYKLSLPCEVNIGFSTFVY